MVWNVARLFHSPKESPVCLECRLPFVSFLYVDIVEPPSDIKFGEVLGSPEFIGEFGDERERVFVLDCHCV